MLMSPDSSSADPDPLPIPCSSLLSMIQVPECTQSHGGPVIKSHNIQIVDYKKSEILTNGYLSSPTKLMSQSSVFHQKPSMMPKNEEDLNLGNDLG